MTSITDTIDQLDWLSIRSQLGVEGYVLLPQLIDPNLASHLAHEWLTSATRRTQSLASMDLGQGEVSFFTQSPQAPWSAARRDFYRHLAPIANDWNQLLEVRYRYPDELEAFRRKNHHAGQKQAQSHVLRLGREDYLSLHQRGLGKHVFPMQVVILLSDPQRDFEGGEFVLTEQHGRALSQPKVVPLQIGDAAIICTAERPAKGSKSYHRADMKHAISRVRRGYRVGVELSFHDA